MSWNFPSINGCPEIFSEIFLIEKVKRPLEGLKVAGYVGCQTNRPFGIDGEYYEKSMYMNKLVETLGGDALAE